MKFKWKIMFHEENTTHGEYIIYMHNDIHFIYYVWSVSMSNYNNFSLFLLLHTDRQKASELTVTQNLLILNR